ncbi:Nitric oxide reductase activation protein [Hydrogenophaga sp. T4]|nr:Nitric oxide reductase activation protein [Hydrogenophaga sp. T4]
MREGVTHRLLLLLSDGKPNDCDVYEGRYGIEDTRQAVTEARLHGISPFCLAVDRQAASYLPPCLVPGTTPCCRRRPRCPPCCSTGCSGW